MPFVEVTKRFNHVIRAPLTLRVKQRKHGLALIASFTFDLGEQLGWEHGSGIIVGVGDGEDKGKVLLRAVPEGTGVGAFNKLNKHYQIDFGYIAQLCDVPRKRAAAPAVVQAVKGANVLLVTLPTEWPLEDDEGEPGGEEDEEETGEPAEELAEEHAPAAKPPAPVRAAAPPQPNGSKHPVENRGVRVEFFRSGGKIIVDDKAQANLGETEVEICAALLRVFQQVLPVDRLAAAVYGPKHGDMQKQALGAFVTGMKPRLDSVGLKITHVRPMGFALARI